MDERQKIGLGAVLAAAAGCGMTLSAVLDWSSAARPWGFLLGFSFGVAAGLGVALVVSGLLGCRRTG
jgi:predicted ABC-type sugar transport system permease subunit